MNSMNVVGYGAIALIALGTLMPAKSAMAAQRPKDPAATQQAKPAATAGPAKEAQAARAPLRAKGARTARRISLNHRIALYARRFVGRYRYEWGGDSPATGFDCSGLTHYVYHHFGKRIPRTAEEQYLAFRRISRHRARPGDLVFFHYGDWVYHVGVYEGRSRMVAAADEAEGIRYETIWTPEVTFGTITHLRETTGANIGRLGLL